MALPHPLGRSPRFAALLLFFWLGSPWCADEAGRRLYLEGVTPSGEPLRALVGFGQTPLSGQAVACGNCHGADGQGRPEGGVLPLAIGWEELTKPYGHAHASRRHGAFDERSFARAVNEGLDPAGNRLDWAMPRYALSRADAEALVAHLKRLREERAPGVGEAALRIGTILPDRGRLAPAAGAMRAALAAYAETLNRAGGIHQRRLELIVASDYREARERFAKEPVFALLSPVELEGKGELGAFVLRAKLPTVGPLTSEPNLISESHGFVFQVLPGLAEEAAVLVDFAARRAGSALRGAIVASGAAADDEAAQAADRRCAQLGCGELTRIGWYATRFDAAAAAKRLKAERREQVFYFGADVEFGQLLGELGRVSDASWRPVVYAPGALARAALAARERFSGTLFLAFPAAPAGRTPQSAQAWDALRREFKLGTQYEAAQMAGLAAASVLAEGLRRAGRQLSRERFVQALESLSNYDPQGYGPVVSFGPDRRAGARGGYVLELEPGRGLVPVSNWISLD